MNPVVIVLGASGRLGRAAHPLFLAAGFDVVAVARTLPEAPSAARWISADLACEADRTRAVDAAEVWTAAREYVCVVDSVLDRNGVDAMRRSVRGATDTAVDLHARLTAGGRTVALIAASTTAVLAPGLLQTPYGLAKRRQVITYARSGMPGGALLLPQLAPTCVAGPVRHIPWSFGQAAQRIVAAAVVGRSRDRFVIQVPTLTADTARPDTATPPVSYGAVLAHLNSLVLHRDSMWAHRVAAGSRLRLTPRRLRNHIDHHLAPAELVQRFAHRYHLPVIEERSCGSATPNNGAARA